MAHDSQQPVKDPYSEWLGIADGPRPPDHYTLLGLDRSEPDIMRIENAASERIKRIRPLCRAYPTEGTNLLNEITQAKLCLTNDASRSAYDESLLLNEITHAKLCPPNDTSRSPYDESPKAASPTESKEPGKRKTQKCGTMSNHEKAIMACKLLAVYFLATGTISAGNALFALFGQLVSGQFPLHIFLSPGIELLAGWTIWIRSGWIANEIVQSTREAEAEFETESK